MIGLAMMLAAIDLDKPIAIGSPAGIEALSRAARRCGLSVKIEEIGKLKTLSVGKWHDYQSIACTLKWKKLHREELKLIPYFGESL